MKKDMVFKSIQVLFSSLLYALAIKLFIVPADLVTGGTTGLGLAFGHMLNVDLSNFILILNTILLLIGYLVLGKEFALNTFLYTLSMPLILKGLDLLFPVVNLSEDIFLCTLFAGLLIGASIALCMRVGASTGGIDIITLTLKKFFRIPVGISTYIIDFFILLLQLTYQGFEKVLYGLVLAMIYSIVIDKLLIVGNSRIELKIISNKSTQIKQLILEQLDRGLTILHGQGGYIENDKEIILSVINNREFVRFERLVHHIDPEAFIIVTSVTEVAGKGFSLPKSYINKNEQK